MLIPGVNSSHAVVSLHQHIQLGTALVTFDGKVCELILLAPNQDSVSSNFKVKIFDLIVKTKFFPTRSKAF